MLLWEGTRVQNRTDGTCQTPTLMPQPTWPWRVTTNTQQKQASAFNPDLEAIP